LSQNGYLRLKPQLHHLYFLSEVLGLETMMGPMTGDAGIGYSVPKSLT